MKTNKVWTESEVVALINRSDEALRRAMVRLFDRQTADEKLSESTIHRNKRGFNCCDDKRLTYYGRWCKSGKVLTGWHRDKALQLVYKYRKQLAAIANGADAPASQEAKAA